MTIRDLIPWNWGARTVPVKRLSDQPGTQLRRGGDDLFDDHNRKLKGITVVQEQQWERQFLVSPFQPQFPPICQKPHPALAKSD